MSKRVWLILAVGFTALLCLMYSGERFFLWVLLMTSIVTAYARFSIAYTLRSMRIHHVANPEELTGGNGGQSVLFLSNRGVFPLAHMDIHYDTEATLLRTSLPEEERLALADPCFVPSIMPGRMTSIRKAMYFPYRGVFAPGILQGELRDIFGLFQYKIPEKYLTGRQAITVLPKIGASVLTGMDESAAFEGITGGVGEPDPYAISGTRQYRQGDSMKRIHWKLSARMGNLQVKENEMTHAMRVTIFPDLSRHGLVDEAAAALEDRICQSTASVCQTALRENVSFRLVAFGDVRKEITDDDSRALIHFRRFLAGVSFDSPYPFHEVLRMELDKQTAPCLLIVITPDVSPVLSEYLASLSMIGYGVTIVPVAKDMGESVANASTDSSPQGEEAPLRAS